MMLFMKDKKFSFRKLDFNNKQQIKVLSLVIVLACIVLVGTSYAWLVVSTEGKNNVGIVSGTLNLVYDDDGSVITLNDQVPISDIEGMNRKGYEFRIRNEGTVDSDFLVKLVDVELTSLESRLSDSNVKFSLSRNGKVIVSGLISDFIDGVLLGDRIATGNSNTYNLRVWLDEDSFNSDATGKVFKKVLKIEASQKISNRNIVEAFKYDDMCITGGESSCVKTKCYKEKGVSSCPSGTIIKYKVNDNEIVNFHVMFDEGNTMTLQSQKNVVYNTKWSDDLLDDSLGLYKTPLNIFMALEEATKTWSNVNNQTFKMGKTVFMTNEYTSCDQAGICSGDDSYRLDRRTVKARMITVQEAKVLGCNDKNGSCPRWLFNYLNGSTVNNIDEMAGDRYFTLNRYENYSSTCIAISNNGNFALPSVSDQLGTRAVVVINK